MGLLWMRRPCVASRVRVAARVSIAVDPHGESVPHAHDAYLCTILARTYCLADYLSNYIQHPTQKMDYGIFNKVIGREVDQAWWGTRTEHIVGVAACLAITDHASSAFFSKAFLGGKPLCFAKSPATFVAHTFVFIFTGVTAYVGIDAALNPLHKVSPYSRPPTCSLFPPALTPFLSPSLPPSLPPFHLFLSFSLLSPTKRMNK